MIAAIHGPAMGGGCEFSLVCGIVVADETARFAVRETGAGLVPGHRRRLDSLEAGDGLEARNALAAAIGADRAAESEPWEAAANILLDDVIEPAKSHAWIADGIDFAWGTRPRVATRGC